MLTRLVTCLLVAASTFVPSPARAEEIATTAQYITTFNVVAHEDDDLLFINPEISSDIAAGRRVVTLYVTAGDAGWGEAYWRGREAGERAAYAEMAGVPNNGWNYSSITLAGKAVTRAALIGVDNKVTLLFMRLPGGAKLPDGTPRPGNLRALHEGTVSSLATMDNGLTYTEPEIIASLAAAYERYYPDKIRSLDWARAYDTGDHQDHITAAIWAYKAHLLYDPSVIYSYQGYGISSKPANLTQTQVDHKLDTFLEYAPHDRHVCQTRTICLHHTYTPWFARRYLLRTHVN